MKYYLVCSMQHIYVDQRNPLTGENLDQDLGCYVKIIDYCETREEAIHMVDESPDYLFVLETL